MLASIRPNQPSAPCRERLLDDIDRQLLSLLQTKRPRGHSLLARKLSLARTTVVARIARLERSGVVAGYEVRLGARLDASTVRAWCSLSVMPKAGPAVLRALSAMPEGGRGVGRERPILTTWCSCVAPITSSWIACSIRWASSKVHQTRPASCSAAKSTSAVWMGEALKGDTLERPKRS